MQSCPQHIHAIIYSYVGQTLHGRAGLQQYGVCLLCELLESAVVGSSRLLSLREHRQLEIRRRMMSAMAALVGADQQLTDVIPLQNSSSQPVSFRFVNVSRAARVAGGSADLD